VIKCKSGSPCLALVSTVARHDGWLLWLTYHVEEVVEQTFYMVGYNTGEPDIMAGMSRNKCGGEPSSGFMKTFVELQAAGLKVVVALCMTRNIVGANCFVTDELITSRARVKIRMGIMNAEDRMVMIDVLCKAKELSLSDPDTQMSNLTWHGCLGLGDYSIIIIDNGDMGKISMLSREDWDFLADKSEEFVSVLQCENAPSNRSRRDNQMPGAFMVQDKNMVKMITKKPLKYSLLDLAGTAGDLSHPTTGSVVALTDAKIEAVRVDFGQLEAEECFLELVISKSIKKGLVTKIGKTKENLQV
jgi:leucyl aminopeptidase